MPGPEWSGWMWLSHQLGAGRGPASESKPARASGVAFRGAAEVAPEAPSEGGVRKAV